MSTSSNTSNTGPNRFRGDAASFSPSHSSPGMIYQQMQHQMYPHYVYDAPHVIPGQYYPYMAPYVIQPNGPYPEFATYTNAFQGYPVHTPHFPPQPFPSMPRTPMEVGMNMNMDMNMHTHNKVKSNGYSNKHRHNNFGSGHDKIKGVSSPAKEHKITFVADDDSAALSNNESQLDGSMQKFTNVMVERKVENKIKRDPMSYPIYFNTNAQISKERWDSEVEERVNKINQKNERLLNFLKSVDVNNLLVLYKDDSVMVKNFNSSKDYIQKENYSYAAKESFAKPEFPVPSRSVNEGGKSKPANWASFLQANASIPEKKSKQAVKQASTQANQNIESNIQQSLLSENSHSDQKGFQQTGVQALGVLLLRTMYDESLSNIELRNNNCIYRVKMKGLTNTGNICYMNAVLQVLLFCEPLNRLMRLIETRSVGSLTPTSPTPLTDLLINFFNEFTSDGHKAISPELFYTNLITHRKFSHLKWGRQEDAQEFLGYLLDGLHEEFTSAIRNLKTPAIDNLIQDYQVRNDGNNQKISNFKLRIKNAMKFVNNSDTKESIQSSVDNEDDGWSEVGSNNRQVSTRRSVEVEPTPIMEIFGGQFRSVLQVPKSKEGQSITLDPFQCIQLDISDDSINTIEDAFKNFNQPEKISFKSSSSNEVMAKKQTFIDVLPHILIIHLKRFSYQQDEPLTSDQNSTEAYSSPLSGSIEKLRKKITYQHTLKIPEEVLSPIVRKRGDINNNFKLTGVIYHHGISAGGGHYTCDVLRKSSLFDNEEESMGKENDNEWIRIDDTQIEVINQSDVLDEANHDNTKSSYILFYQKV